MKKILAALLLFVSGYVMAQKPEDDLQKVKDALVNSVLYTQELEKQVNNLNITVKKIAEDLKRVKTVGQLDSLKVVYGLAPKKLKQ